MGVGVSARLQHTPGIRQWDPRAENWVPICASIWDRKSETGSRSCPGLPGRQADARTTYLRTRAHSRSTAFRHRVCPPAAKPCRSIDQAAQQIENAHRDATEPYSRFSAFVGFSVPTNRRFPTIDAGARSGSDRLPGLRGAPGLRPEDAGAGNRPITSESTGS